MGKQVKLLGISASPRKGSNSMILLTKALDSAAKVSGVVTEVLDLHKKSYKHCIGCSACNRRREKCILKGDDFEEFFEKWVSADGIIISTPIYHMSVPSNLKAALDRLGNSVISMYPEEPRRLIKVGGAITQGMNRFGGQEFAMQFIINSFLLMDCIPVAGDMPISYIGAGGSTYGDPKAGAISSNENAILSAENIGQRVAELSKIIVTGKEHLRDELPKEYYLDIQKHFISKEE
ncbi:flavodoxin family protein [Schnuerera ultunensis]|uniref:NADPH-dependent FMN reductase-like domain-containing protein n=1 Tax=[Clostridium] ultunense Esp TaxID=1288971 RepID=A0A1M4PKJ0_9FIRM|nr:flavodoxin family protein [Schnuerera ultunensis]SHD75967.1 conserved protein of unknown function [[Clostridium] ultunense Esp]